jgi:hypothetical protein
MSCSAKKKRIRRLDCQKCMIREPGTTRVSRPEKKGRRL